MGHLAKLKAISTQFWPPKPSFTSDNVTDGAHVGKVFVMTGGNSGLGFELCRMLYKGGATIYMATRSRARAEAAFQAIRDAHPTSSQPARLKFLQLLMSDLVSVRNAAAQFAEMETRLDVLWNNAGVGAYAVKYGECTAQGIELIMGINCVGALLFTELLVPQLKAASSETTPTAATTSASVSSSRVVWMSTILVDTAAPRNGVNLDRLRDGTPDRVENYATAKAALWILSREFARRHGPDGILSVAVNPGSLNTGSFRGTPPIQMMLMKLTILHKPVFGAYSMLYAGLSPDVTRENNGIFVYPWGRLIPDDAVVRQDIIEAMKPETEGGIELGAKLWAWCESNW
ncbi:NAD(P)-binding protein [Xylariomycetidae sp. FL2044]|nr:NAD(P)-binding protein [Xylariomycetidae sp. FL2044]